MVSEVGSDHEDGPLVNKTGKEPKRKERKLKVNVRKYTVRAEFTNEKEFDGWIEAEIAKSPWYMCSSYQAGGITKRIYACSFRKRSGYKKCERQLMVLFYPPPDGRVVVQDSSSDLEHVHERIDVTEISQAMRTVISLRSPAEFSSWMEKQRERYAWHKRAGRRPVSHIDYYQCISVGDDGAMCKRLMLVEHTPENGVVVKEFENLLPHDQIAAHRRTSASPVKLQKRSKRADSDSEYIPSTSSKKPRSSRPERSFLSGNIKEEPEDSERNVSDGIVFAMDDGAAELGPSIEDFVIIPDEEYEDEELAEHKQHLDDGSRHVKQEVLEAANFGISVKKERRSSKVKAGCAVNGEVKSRKRSIEKGGERVGTSKKRPVKNGVLPAASEPSNDKVASAQQTDEKNHDNSDNKYNLENFVEELATKLSKTPLERMKEVRESVRREMDEVFAQQLVKEIASRTFSLAARREVIDRIREVLRSS